MVLTPEDVVNKRFQTTKFRDGYDQDEVDDFLDEVVGEMRRLTAENEDLRQKLAAAGVKTSSGEMPSTPAFPSATVVAAATLDPAEATNSNSLLQLARKLHEEHVRDGLGKRDALIRDGQENASRIVREAETQARTIIAQLERDRKAIEITIDDLREFEHDYRSRLREYIESQLNTLAREASFESTEEAFEAVVEQSAGMERSVEASSAETAAAVADSVSVDTGEVSVEAGASDEASSTPEEELEREFNLQLQQELEDQARSNSTEKPSESK